jgi:hypothetical protein
MPNERAQYPMRNGIEQTLCNNAAFCSLLFCDRKFLEVIRSHYFIVIRRKFFNKPTQAKSASESLILNDNKLSHPNKWVVSASLNLNLVSKSKSPPKEGGCIFVEWSTCDLGCNASKNCAWSRSSLAGFRRCKKKGRSMWRGDCREAAGSFLVSTR